MESERRLNVGFITLLFVCLLGSLLAYYFMTVPYKCPSKRETGKVYDNSTNCLGRVYSLFSNREKISFKTIFKLMTVKANIHRVVCVRQ